MDDQRTCGKGLAEHSGLPAKLADLIAAVGRVLELHMRALDVTDENSRREREAYQGLVNEHRKIASDLRVTAGRMAGYRDLPMGRHDERLVSDASAVDAFENVITIEQQLGDVLQKKLQQDQAILTLMEGAR